MVMLDWYLIWMLFYWNVPGNCNFLPICFGTCAFVPEELMMDLLLVWVEYPPYQIKALKLARACGVPAVGVWVVDCWQKLLRMPKNLGVDTFLDPVGYFGGPWPFLILQEVQRCRR